MADLPPSSAESPLVVVTEDAAPAASPADDTANPNPYPNPAPSSNGAPPEQSSSSSTPASLTPAQQRQLQADAAAAPSSAPTTAPSQKRPRKPSSPPNILSEGDFPSLSFSSPKATTTTVPTPPVHRVPVISQWGQKQGLAQTRPPVPTTNGSSSLPAPNGKTASSNSSRASTPALPTPPRPPHSTHSTRGLHSQTVTELLRFQKHQLQNPGSKDFGSVADRIARVTGVDGISVTRMKVSEVVTFSITGKPENVIKARNRLQNEIGVKRTEKVIAPTSVLSYIIGKKGANLRAIQDNSGANVQIPKRVDSETTSVVADDDNTTSEQPEDNVVEITIEGIDAAVSKAKDEINKIIDERTSKKTERLTDIPADFFLLLAGPNDANIKDWEGPPERDIKIRIPNPHHPTATDEHITLTGHRDLVAQARDQIEAQYRTLKASTTAVKVDVTRAQHRFLIGDRGDGLKTLLAETGCAVIVPPLSVEAGDDIVIRADRSNVGVGLGKVLQRASEVTLVTVDLAGFTGRDAGGLAHARKFYRYARRQNLFAKLSSQHDAANLTIPKSSSIMSDSPAMHFEIDGKDSQAVYALETALKSLIQSFPREKFTTIEIDPCLHGVLIGKKGSGLQSLRDHHTVNALFDEADPEILLVYEGPDDPATALDAVKTHLHAVAAQQSDITEQTLQIARKYHKIIVGPNGTTLNALMGDHGAGMRSHVYVGGKSRDPEKQDDVVIVRGPSADVARIAKAITEHVAEAKHTEFITSHVEEFGIPEAYSKNVIGKGGKRISELREKFGVQIKVDEGRVHIQGVKKNCEEARKTILGIVDELKDDTISRLPIKNEHHGNLIGEKGANVRRLQERYAVRIHFPRREDEEDRASTLPDEERPRTADEIVIRGPSKGVKSTVDELNALLEYRIQHSHTAEIDILARGRQRLLRNAGGIVHSLRQDAGYVRIDVPPRTDDEKDDSVIRIRVEGTAEFVKRAVAEIGSLRDEVKGEKIVTMTIEQRHHKGLIGPSGRTLQKTIVDAGGPEDKSIQARIVRFPRPGDESDRIVLTGSPAVVDKIAERFAEFAARETIEVDVPTEKLSRIIGAGGRKRMELEAEFDVVIYVPQMARGSHGSVEKVKVTGKPEQNQKAKKAILDIVKSGDGVVIQVPKRLHHRLSNDGRTKNQLRQKWQVYISHDGTAIPPTTTPKPVNGTQSRIDDDNTDESYSWHVEEEAPQSDDDKIPWKLRGGNESNVSKAKDHLEQLVASLRDQGNCTGYLGIPPEHHHLVIGKGGARIGAVRDETGCMIDVPKRGEGNDTIVIRGSREGVERAREMIIESVENAPSNRSNGSSPQRARRDSRPH